jgi:thiamine biosynthesis lipoprotein
MAQQITRRRIIRISAAAAGLSLSSFGGGRAVGAGLTTWRGTVLGAVATIEIHHSDRAFTEHLIERSITEVHRLEQLFSLYLEDSDLVRLNKYGALAAPAPELVELLLESHRYSVMSRGAFDVTVQPFWNLYAEHFSEPNADPDGPSARAVSAARERVGHDALSVNQDRIAFAKPGMGVTLNGIAQGYITDRVIDVLRAEGITQTLVDMGETRCLGTHPSGRPWQVGIADPDQPTKVRENLAVVNQAVATSGGYGFQFDAAGRFNHLFDPKTGHSPHIYRSVTVVASTAAAADALSTAFSLMRLPDIERMLVGLDNTAVYLILHDGTVMRRPQA